jgi:hypothetical protein
MRLKLLGGSCAALAVICIALAGLATFIGAILVGQAVTDVTFPQVTAPATRPSISSTQTPQPPVTSGNHEQPIGVTIVAPTPFSSGAATNTTQGMDLPSSATPTPSANPILISPLGTLDYPLTVTAEAQAMSTRVNAYRTSVDATRTAAATQVVPTHAALTLTAAAGGK